MSSTTPLDIHSPFSGRKVATITLTQPTERVAEAIAPFRVLDGFGNLWRKSFDEAPLVIYEDDDFERLVSIAAFPAEEDATGFVRFERCIPKGQLRQTVTRPKRQPVWRKLYARLRFE